MGLTKRLWQGKEQHSGCGKGKLIEVSREKAAAEGIVRSNQVGGLQYDGELASLGGKGRP